MNLNIFTNFRLKIFFIIFLLACTNSPLLIAYESKVDNAISDLSYECIECAAYYQITSEAFLKINDTTEALDFKKIASSFMRIAHSLNKDMTESMKPEAIDALFEIVKMQQRDEIDNDLQNISILIAKHAVKCKNIGEHPDCRLLYWANKV